MMRAASRAAWAAAICCSVSATDGEQQLAEYELLLTPRATAFAPCMKKANRSGNDTAGNPLYVIKVNDVRPCLDNIKTDTIAMILTLENLEEGVDTIYSFSQIASNSKSCKQKNRCGLEVHDVSVDLFAGLQEIERTFIKPAAQAAGVFEDVEQKSPRDVLDLMTLPTNVSALQFHSALNALFARLYDAHTTYALLTGISQVLPVHFMLVAPENETATPEEGRFDALPQTTTPLLPKVVARPREMQEYKEVDSVNGQNALSWLQQLADRAGLYKDEGQRLNDNMLRSQNIFMSDFHLNISRMLWTGVGLSGDLVGPANTTVNITFKDRSTFSQDWLVYLNPLNVERSLTEPGDDFRALQRMELERAEWSKKKDKELEAMTDDMYNDGSSDVAARRLAARSQTSYHAVRAYKRLLGDHYSTDVLNEVAALYASRVASRTAAGPQSAGGTGDKAGRSLRGGASTSHWAAAAISGEKRTDRSLQQEDDNDQGMPMQVTPPNLSDTNLTADFSQCLGSFSNYTGEVADVLYVFKDPENAGIVMALGLNDTVVLKLNSMSVGANLIDRGGGPVMEAFIAANEYAKGKGINRFLLDLVGNGGGSVALSDMLQSIILKNYHPEKLCLDYNKRINSYWREWIRSFGVGIDGQIDTFLNRIKTDVNGLPLQVVKWTLISALEYLIGIIRVSNSLLSSELLKDECTNVPFPTTKVKDMMARVNATKSTEEAIELFEGILHKREFVPNCLFYSGEEGEDERPDHTGWYPFLGQEIKDRSTLKPFPDLRGLLEPVHQDWGRDRMSESFYSQKGVFATCMSILLLLETDFFGARSKSAWQDHPFTDLAVLTDGTSGSAASALPSRLMASGYATMFTYGGNGKIMDSSSFAGGDVQLYNAVWPRVLVAAEFGMWLLPDSPWKNLSKSQNYTSEASLMGDTIIYPRPPPLQNARARFNFNMMYVPQFAEEGDNTMLPREFYRLPAHRHLDVWPMDLADVCMNPFELMKMYGHISKFDWWGLRKNPQYLDKGWSCVPEESVKTCCKVEKWDNSADYFGHAFMPHLFSNESEPHAPAPVEAGPGETSTATSSSISVPFPPAAAPEDVAVSASTLTSTTPTTTISSIGDPQAPTSVEAGPGETSSQPDMPQEFHCMNYSTANAASRPEVQECSAEDFDSRNFVCIKYSFAGAPEGIQMALARARGEEPEAPEMETFYGCSTRKECLEMIDKEDYTDVHCCDKSLCNKPGLPLEEQWLAIASEVAITGEDERHDVSMGSARLAPSAAAAAFVGLAALLSVRVVMQLRRRGQWTEVERPLAYSRALSSTTEEE